MASIADQVCEKEHIIQDNCSNLNKARLLAGRPHALIHEESDMGMYDAVTRGLLKASGDILCYINCDEQFLEGALPKVIDYFVKNPACEVLFGDMITGDRNGNPFTYKRTLLPTLRHTRLAALSVFTCSTFFRRSLLEKGLWFDPGYRIIGDSVWVDKLIRNRVRLRKINQPLSYFANLPGNLGSDQRRTSEESQWRLQTPPSWIKARRLIMLWYGVRKLLAGGYRNRTVRYAIYTLNSAAVRQQFYARSLTWRWHFPNAAPDGDYVAK